MEQLEALCQKHVSSLCKILPTHVETWRSLLQEAVNLVKSLETFSEQLRHVEKAKIDSMNHFEVIQSNLNYLILELIDKDINELKLLIDRLNNCNHDLKNKLSVLERSTVELDWDRSSLLIKGTGIQPPLSKILQNGYDFWNFFAIATKLINQHFKSLDIRNTKSLIDLKNALQIDLKTETVTYFLAITQYVDNEKTVV